MSEDPIDQHHFFDRFTRFVETSETSRNEDGRELARLNARYVALVHAHRDVIAGAHVLDLASHDGRFGFAALCNGAEKLVGIEIEPGLVQKAEENLEFYKMPRDSYEFIVGDIFDDIARVERCDVVFCFGILYHINDHMRLLTKIAEAQPRWLIIDSNIAPHEDAIIELRNAMTGRRPPPGGQFEGYPSKAALDTMLSSFGWSMEYFDWAASSLVDDVVMSDYRKGDRVSALVNCGEQYPEEVRAQAVRAVFERQSRRREQWRCIKEVAAESAMTPQALGIWVRKAEREALQKGE
jgi:hypothetical protein